MLPFPLSCLDRSHDFVTSLRGITTQVAVQQATNSHSLLIQVTLIFVLKPEPRTNSLELQLSSCSAASIGNRTLTLLQWALASLPADTSTWRAREVQRETEAGCGWMLLSSLLAITKPQTATQWRDVVSYVFITR